MDNPTIELKVDIYGTREQDVACQVCDHVFMLFFDWHIKFVSCPECKTTHEVRFV